MLQTRRNAKFPGLGWPNHHLNIANSAVTIPFEYATIQLHNWRGRQNESAIDLRDMNGEKFTSTNSDEEGSSAEEYFAGYADNVAEAAALRQSIE